MRYFWNEISIHRFFRYDTISMIIVRWFTCGIDTRISVYESVHDKVEIRC